MKYVIKTGSTSRIVDADIIQEKLPLGTYNLCFNPHTMEYYLDKVQDLEIPKKIYGDTSIVDRIINVYRNKTRNVGIMLYGLKGSGRYILNMQLYI